VSSGGATDLVCGVGVGEQTEVDTSDEHDGAHPENIPGWIQVLCLMFRQAKIQFSRFARMECTPNTILGILRRRDLMILIGILVAVHAPFLRVAAERSSSAPGTTSFGWLYMSRWLLCTSQVQDVHLLRSHGMLPGPAGTSTCLIQSAIDIVCRCVVAISGHVSVSCVDRD